MRNLPEPHALPLYTYDEVHEQGAGAYIAELFDAHAVPERVLLGDGSVLDVDRLPCRACRGIFFESAGDDGEPRRLAAAPPQHMIDTRTLSKDGRLSPDSNYTVFIQVPKRGRA